MKKYTFNSFVVGPCNRIAYEAAKQVAHRPGKAFNPLHICGATGLGATHLMRAIGHAVVKRNRHAKIAFTTAESFTTSFIDALQRRRLAGFRKHYRDLDVLLFDDIQYLSGKECTQAELNTIVRDLLEAGKQIVLTSDRPAVNISDFNQHLVSLFASGLVATLCPPDQITRIAILKQKSKMLHVQVPDQVLNHIARHIHTDIRRLEGALISVAADSSLDDCPLSLAKVDRIMRNYVADTNPPPARASRK